MTRKENLNGHEPRISAPIGMYERLKSIELGKLGNVYRKIIVIPIGDDFSNLEVVVRVSRGHRVTPQTVYNFTVTPGEEILDLTAKEVRLDPHRFRKLPTPKFRVVMGAMQDIMLTFSKDKTPIG